MRGDPDRRCARITNTMIKFMHTFELPGMHTTMARGLALLLDTRHLSLLPLEPAKHDPDQTPNKIISITFQVHQCPGRSFFSATL